jgi:pyruvate dehydrogenase E2 component (dihydrolipoamide acetyltransferase)
MATEIVMPRLSDTMDRGTIARWVKKVGDPVKRGEVLLEIETDKANMELESYADGFLASIGVQEGESASVGAPIAVVADNDSELRQLQSTSPHAEAPDADVTASTSSTKSPHSTPATSTPDEDNDRNGEPQAAEARAPDESRHPDGRVKVSPLARRLAEQRGIDLESVTGTGPGGRIVKQDVEDVGGRATSGPPPRLVDEEVQLSRMQQAVGRRLSESMLSAPHFYVTSEIDMTRAVELRKQLIESSAGFKLTYNDLIVKAVGLTLRRFPSVNSSFMDGRAVRHGSVNVSIAIDLPEGLTVPVVRDVDSKPLKEIAREAHELAEAARNGHLKQSQLEGGTFTVSNLGMYGVRQFTAIINPPQSAILATGAISEQPRVIDEVIEVRSVMLVTLSSDHRLIYGAEAARFLAELRGVLEHPAVCLL